MADRDYLDKAFQRLTALKIPAEFPKNMVYSRPEYCIIVLVQRFNQESDDSGCEAMLIQITTLDGIPIYRQIIRQIKYMIASGRLVAGDKLPPIRKLAEQLLINPNTVARSYRELERDGLLVLRQGCGASVSDSASSLPSHESMRSLGKRVDLLIVEAQQMGVSPEQVIELVHKRIDRMNAIGAEK